MFARKITRILTLSLLLSLTVKTYAQQEPQYSQYMFNMMSVNPAYTGTRQALNAIVLSRWQWVGVEGAPKSHTFALHTPIKDKKIGIGASVIADDIGPVNNTYINLNYAHRIKLNQKITLSFGLKGGIYNYYVGLSNLQLNDDDNSFYEDYRRNFQPNIGAGAYMYAQNYYVGLSVPKIVKTELENEGSDDNVSSELKRHFFLTGGYLYELNSQWKLKPSALLKMVEGAPPSLDITAQALYMDRFWLGTTYRVGDAFAFLLQVQATQQLIVGYSYDLTTSAMSSRSYGTHEIIISFDFAGFTNDKVKSPRYF